MTANKCHEKNNEGRMKYLSVCSGVEAATVAWHPLGWEPVAFSEIEKFPSQVLQHHYPDVPNLGDMTKYKEWNLGAIDLLVGGTPCQSFSVAGLRKGLDDPRGNLALVYCGILDHYRPQWFVWENVPGVLSSNGGRDFGSFLGALAQLGYGFAYRVLDAQYWGVAQRRKRVFVVGYLGDWRPAAAVLFESKSLSRDTQPSREKGQETSRCLTRGSAQRYDAESETMIPMAYRKSKRAQTNQDDETWVGDGAANTLSVFDSGDTRTTHAVVQPITFPSVLSNQSVSTENLSCTLEAKNPTAVMQPVAVDVYNQAIDGQTAATLTQACGGTNTSGPKVMQPVAYNIAPGKGALKDDIHVTPGDVTKTLDASGSNPAMHQGGSAVMQPVAPTLTASNDPSRSPQSTEVTNQVAAVHAASMAVRRLTPVECERLQGFPDNYTNIKENCPDGPRYKAMGNSMAVPVMRWIGERIALYSQP